MNMTISNVYGVESHSESHSFRLCTKKIFKIFQDLHPNILSGSYNHLEYIIIKESLTKDCLRSLLLRRPPTAERNGVGSWNKSN